MKMKKVLVLACVVVMMLSLAVPASAAAIENSMSTDFTGAVADGEVAVTLMAGKTNLYVNPYGIPYASSFGEVKVGGVSAVFDKTKDFAIAETAVTNSLFSDTAIIRNDGDTALDVKVSMVTTPTANVAVVADATAAGTTSASSHAVYGSLEVAPATSSTGTAKVTTTAATGSDPAVKGDVTGVTIITPNWTSSDKKTIAIPSVAAGTAASSASAAAPAGTLTAAAEVEDMASGTTSVVPGYLAYRLIGTAVPKTDGSAWNDDDTVSVSVAFTFAPHVDPPAGP